MLHLLSSPPILLIAIHELKNHLRLDYSHDDSYLESLISVATTMVEEYCGQSLLLKKWKKTYQHHLTDGVCGEIVRLVLPYPPLVEIESIFFVHEKKGTRKETKRYHLNNTGTQAFVELIVAGGVTEITYTSGYGMYPVNVPAVLRHGVMLVAAQLYEHRDGFQIEGNHPIGGALKPYRVMGLG